MSGPRATARAGAAAGALLLTLGTTASGRACAAAPVAAPPGAVPHSAYEQAAISAALDALGLEPDDAPDGKTVEAVHVVRLDVIEERDPAPRVLNRLHALTREPVIAREVLLRPGDRFDRALADETQRNLAAVPQLSLAVVLPVQGTAPDRVRILVVTKDVWSLRLNADFAYSSGGLESLTLQPSETNLLGARQDVGLDFRLLPLSYALGLRFTDPRVADSHVAATTGAAIIVDRQAGRPEGSRGSLQLGSPLWSSLARWSWNVGGAWDDEVTRLYSNARLVHFSLAQGTTGCTPGPLCVPVAYRGQLGVVSADGTRSLGETQKHDLTLGGAARWSHYQLPDLSGYDPGTVQELQRRYLPVGEDRIGPYLQYRTYSTRYLRVLDLQTLALQEDHRLGMESVVRLEPYRRLGAGGGNGLGFLAGAWVTAPVADGLLRVGGDTSGELDLVSGQVTQGAFTATLGAATPAASIGRLVLQADVVRRFANAHNVLEVLGGDTRLRGFPTGYFVGPDLLVTNLEYRSRPLQAFRSVHVSATVFYDSGDAFGGWDALHVWQSTGIGVRLLFPQLDRTVFRLDVGFPLSRPLPPGVSTVAVFASLGQAFGVP